MAKDLFSNHLRDLMPEHMSAASVLEWLERPPTELGWLLVPTPLSFGAADATPNFLLRLFEHGADTEGWELLWPRLLSHPLVNASLEGQWERFVLPGAFRAARLCARPLLEHWANNPKDDRPIRLEISPDPAQPEHLPEWLWSLLHGYPETSVDAIAEALSLASQHGWLLPHQPIRLKNREEPLPLAFFLATFPGRQGKRFDADDLAYVNRVLGAFGNSAWELPEISRWLSDPLMDTHYVNWLEQGLRSGVLLGRSLPAG